MNIEILDEHKLCILLDTADMENLNLTCEEMEYSNEETRKILWELFYQAQDTTDPPIHLSGRTLIEVIPMLDGGCLIYFTVLEPQKQQSKAKQPKKLSSAGVFEFSNAEDYLSMMDAFSMFGTSVVAQLYTKDNIYRLLIENLTPKDPICTFLSEFVSLSSFSPLTAAQTMEHWTQVGDELDLSESF